MNDLSEFQRDILYVCAGIETPYGLGIKKELDEYYEAEFTSSRLYINLNTLAERGLLDVRVIDTRKKEYTLTQEGKAQIKNRREWENQYLDQSKGLKIDS